MIQSQIAPVTGRRPIPLVAVLSLGLIACMCGPLSGLLSKPLPPPDVELTEPPVAPDLEAPPQEPVAPAPQEPRSVSGTYRTLIDDLLDFAEHLGFIGMLTAEFEMDVRQSNITFDGPDPFVDVVGVLNENGSFEATGAGTVAGFPDVTVRMVGMITYERYEAYYIMGAGGELPQEQSITYRAQGVRSPEDGTEIGPIVPEDLEVFLATLVEAIQTRDTVFLFARLNPGVIARYGPEACQASLDGVPPDATYQIEVLETSGPAPWDYVTDGVTTTIADTMTVHAMVTSLGETTDRELHFAQPGSFLTWATDCGETVS